MFFVFTLQRGIEIGGKQDVHKYLFEQLKDTVYKECSLNHSWQSMAADSLVRLFQIFSSIFFIF